MTVRGRNSSLPGVLREIADVAGVEAAWALARAHGGMTAYITLAPIEGHWLVEAVGREAAARICEKFGGLRILIPQARIAQQQERLVKSLEAGLSISQAVSVSGMHERTVFRTKKRLKEQLGEPDDKQFKLL
jgi:hypothetical protein